MTIDTSDLKMNCVVQNANGTICLTYHFSGNLQGKSENGDSSGGCFSGNMKVVEKKKGLISIADVEIGDAIMAFDEETYQPIFSRVTTFLHRVPENDFSYIRFGLRGGDGFLESTPTHNIATGRAMDYVYANHLAEKDELILLSDDNDGIVWESISSIAFVQERGAYAPFTEHSNYFVGSSMRDMVLVHVLADVPNPKNVERAISWMVYLSSFIVRENCLPTEECLHPLTRIGRVIQPYY
jgi:hypothetical protein